MSRIHERGHLKPIERELVRNLYVKYGQSGQKIANLLKTSKSAVYRIVQGLKRGPVVEVPEAILAQLRRDDDGKRKPSSSWTLSPLDFRIAKMQELQNDIQLTRARGSVNVLPQLHKLHVQLFDELTAIRADLAEFEGEMSPEQMLNSIIETIMSLPPSIRHTIHGTLDDMESGKLIRL